MAKLTMIARVTDGLPLAEGVDDGRDVPDADSYKQQAKTLFENLSSEASRKSLETGPYMFHYIIEGRACYLAMCDRYYPEKLVFQYLEDLKKEFERAYGNQIETAAGPYAFNEFDTFIQKTKIQHMNQQNQLQSQQNQLQLDLINDLREEKITIEDIGKGAAKFKSWLQEKEADLVGEGVDVPSNIQCGELIAMCAMMLTGELSVTPYLPSEGVGEAKDTKNSKRKCSGEQDVEQTSKQSKIAAFLGEGEGEGESEGEGEGEEEKGFPGIRLCMRREIITDGATESTPSLCGEDQSTTSSGLGVNSSSVGSLKCGPLPPWMNGDGTLNESVYKGLRRQILGILFLNPFILEEGIISRMEMQGLNAQSCRQLIKIMITENHIFSRTMQHRTCGSPAILRSLMGDNFVEPEMVSRVYYSLNPRSVHLL